MLLSEEHLLLGGGAAVQDAVCFLPVGQHDPVVSAKCSPGRWFSRISSAGPVFMVAVRVITTWEQTVHWCCCAVSNALSIPHFVYSFVVIIDIDSLFTFTVLLNWFYPNPQVLPFVSSPTRDRGVVNEQSCGHSC